MNYSELNMSYSAPKHRINPGEYDGIVSIGNKCPTAIALRSLELYKESYPFDYIPTTPKLIHQYFVNNATFFPKKNTSVSDDGVWFGHFDLDDNYEKTIETFRKRFDRLFHNLNQKKRMLFVYTSEADCYNEMGNRYNDNYHAICALKNHITQQYNYDNFTIVAIHMNKIFSDDTIIKNYCINVPERYLSDNMETHTPETCEAYKHTLEKLMRKIFMM